MDVRRLLNIAYTSLVEGLDKRGRDNIDYELGLPFEHEMTPEQKRREEYRRKAIEIGADIGQDDLMRVFGMQQAGA